jgi:hypothetical protein
MECSQHFFFCKKTYLWEKETLFLLHQMAENIPTIKLCDFSKIKKVVYQYLQEQTFVSR